MRIVVVEHNVQGGLLHYAVQLADGLAARGHDVELLVPRGNELAQHVGAARMRAILPPPIHSVEQPRSRVAYAIRRAGIAGRLARGWLRALVLTRRGVDAVVLTGDTHLTLSTIGAGLLTLGPGRPRVAAVCHNVRVFNRWGGDELHITSRATLAPLRWLYPRLDAVFVHGERSEEEFRAAWPPARLAVIPHGDEGLFGATAPPPATEPRALFFGDWRKVKGLTVLMEAFDLLWRRRPEMRLTIAGTPAPADFDPGLVHRWAACHDGRVTVIDDYVPLAAVPAVFATARAVVNPYLTGSQSGVVHLAMTMGRAVIASDVGDLGAAVRDGETGLLVPIGDARSLADALERVLGDPELAQRMGAAGRRRVLRESSWDTVAQHIEAALITAPDRR